MNKGYLLDTSAIFAFTDDEEGSDRVEDLLSKARRREASLGISAMTLMEIYYVALEERGEAEADHLLLLVRALPVAELSLSDDVILPAARLKAGHQVSVADAWIAATAIAHNLVLVHKDPELETLGKEVSLLALPYKSKKKK